jgi:tight adherence protein B
MSVLAVLVFTGVFAIVLLLSMSIDSSGVEARKQTRQRLDSISLAAERSPQDDDIGLVREELLSSAPWLNQWLQRQDLFAGLRKLLDQAEIHWTVMGLLLMSAASWALSGAAVFMRTDDFMVSALVGAAAAVGPFLFVRFKRTQRFEKFERGLPKALDLMVSALRAGHSLISALESVVKEMPNPIGSEFRKCFDEQTFGLDMRESMLNLGARVPIHDVHIVITAILIQKESGGNLAEILDKVSSIIRERFRLKKQVQVHTAQGRLTGWILSLLPVVLGLALYMVNPDHMSVLWQNPLGLKMIYAALILTVIGALIIRKIVNIRI